MTELLPCPFCGVKQESLSRIIVFMARILSRVQVICNRCKSRGKPIITKPMIKPDPYITEWGICYGASDRAKTETERFRPYVEKRLKLGTRAR